MCLVISRLFALSYLILIKSNKIGGGTTITLQIRKLKHGEIE